MSIPFVTYVVTVCNQAPHLEGLVRRILAQSIRPIDIVFADERDLRMGR